mmetsp:Transcript_12370/g.32819  ORF Transcript_12370/g.32819 Transcript_12370/m.32819 type:complete len:261 (+) Transcript_12370:269-1051(+)
MLRGEAVERGPGLRRGWTAARWLSLLRPAHRHRRRCRGGGGCGTIPALPWLFLEGHLGGLPGGRQGFSGRAPHRGRFLGGKNSHVFRGFRVHGTAPHLDRIHGGALGGQGSLRQQEEHDAPARPAAKRRQAGLHGIPARRLGSPRRVASRRSSRHDAPRVSDAKHVAERVRPGLSVRQPRAGDRGAGRPESQQVPRPAVRDDPRRQRDSEGAPRLRLLRPEPPRARPPRGARAPGVPGGHPREFARPRSGDHAGLDRRAA